MSKPLPGKEPKWGRSMIPQDPKDPSDGFWIAVISAVYYIALGQCDASAFADEYLPYFLRGFALTFMAGAAGIIWKDTE